MTQEWITTTAIVFRAIEMKENDRLITLFSSELGIIKTYLCKVRSKNNPLDTASNALVESEWVLKPGREELYLCREASVITQNLQLRTSYGALQAACALTKITEASLVQGDPCPEVFDLFKFFLKHLPDAKSPAAVKAIYQLKLLSYHGLLGDDDPEAFVELSSLRSLEALLGLDLPEGAIEDIDNLFVERFQF